MSNITIMTTKAKYPGNLADEHFHLKAQIADLKRELSAVEDAIYLSGERVIEGNFARVTVSEVKPGTAIDYKAAAEAYLAPAVVAGFTKLRNGSIRVISNARQGHLDIAS